MLLLIDNYDSFTWNLYQYFSELGSNVYVVRNDQITLDEIKKLPLTQLVISPGPCNPDRSGISMKAIRYFAGHVPILGVCLGHQAIAQAYGARIIHAQDIMHGKTSLLQHNNKGLFINLKNPLSVIRYNSLVIERNTIPVDFEVTAWSIRYGIKDEIMGLRHTYLPIEGVQFHPESILSEQGHQLLANFLKL